MKFLDYNIPKIAQMTTAASFDKRPTMVGCCFNFRKTIYKMTLVLCLALGASSGCASLYTVGLHARGKPVSTEGKRDDAKALVFSGMRYYFGNPQLFLSTYIFFIVLDFPLSLIFDVALLPVTVPWAGTETIVNAYKNKSKRHRAALRKALKSNDLPRLKHLIRKGYDVNAGPKYQEHLLHIAVKKPRLEALKLLLAGGAEPNARDTGGWTALHYAAEEGPNPNSVQLLLQNGASVNIIGEYGNTPLHRAVARGNVQIVQMLIRSGADLHIRNGMYETPYLLARAGGHRRILKLLERKGVKN